MAFPAVPSARLEAAKHAGKMPKPLMDMQKRRYRRRRP